MYNVLFLDKNRNIIKDIQNMDILDYENYEEMDMLVECYANNVYNNSNGVFNELFPCPKCLKNQCQIKYEHSHEQCQQSDDGFDKISILCLECNYMETIEVYFGSWSNNCLMDSLHHWFQKYFTMDFLNEWFNSLFSSDDDDDNDDADEEGNKRIMKKMKKFSNDLRR